VTDSSRTYIQSEFSQLSSEIDSIATGTSYSGQSLLDGTSDFSGGVAVMVGSSASDTITVTINTLTTTKLAISGLDISSQAGATSALSALSTAIGTVSAARATLGAEESRFNFSANSIATQTQNLQAANSVVTDVDVASEEATLSSAEVKTQAAVSAETAANQMPQFLLKLLG
jgi:flagellin